jgi:hypothetical protein
MVSWYTAMKMEIVNKAIAAGKNHDTVAFSAFMKLFWPVSALWLMRVSLPDE